HRGVRAGGEGRGLPQGGGPAAGRALRAGGAGQRAARPGVGGTMTMKLPKLFIRGVGKRVAGGNGEVLALEDVWVGLAQGEFVMLVGPSGCGKSTLLNIVAGLDPADSGQVLEDGRPMSGPGRDRSVVFQDGALFPWLTARKNVEFGLKQMGMPRRE